MELFKISITTSVLIIFLLVLTPILNKRYPAKWRYIVWFVLMIRLLIPVTVSLSNAPITIYIEENEVSDTLQQIPKLELQQINQSMINIDQKKIVTNQKEYNTNLSYSHPDLSNSKAFKNTIKATFVQFIFIIWVIGILFYLGLQIISYTAFKRKLNYFSKEDTSFEMQNLLMNIGRESGLKKLPDLKLSTLAKTPVLIGLIKPCILLPHENYSKEEAEFILRHELIHFTRHDLWYQFMLIVTKSIHWFNPFVHLMSVKASQDIEFSCDEKLISNMDENSRMLYGTIILKTLPRKKEPDACLMAHFGSRKKNVKRRLKNLFDTRTKKKGIIPCIMLILSTGILCGLITFTPTLSEVHKQEDTPIVEDIDNSTHTTMNDMDDIEDSTYAIVNNEEESTHSIDANSMINEIINDSDQIDTITNTNQKYFENDSIIIQEKTSQIEDFIGNEDYITHMLELTEPYKAYGLEYNIEENQLYYYNQPVLQFSYYRSFETNDVMGILFSAKMEDSFVEGLSIEALVDEEGNIIGLKQMGKIQMETSS